MTKALMYESCTKNFNPTVPHDEKPFRHLPFHTTLLGKAVTSFTSAACHAGITSVHADGGKHPGSDDITTPPIVSCW